jgi:GDP-4-dehydro-6-deoxy-D-mannose reductase
VRRAIVTGATGFLGQHLVADLRQHGVQVTALARRPNLHEQPWFISMGNGPWSSVRLARIIDAVCPDVIFHLAGGAVGSPPDLIASNVGVTIALMRALQHIAARPLLVCCGSAAEYGAAVVDGVPVQEGAACAPLTPYGTAKLAQTKAVLQFSEATGVPVLVNRIFNMIGPGMPTYLALSEFAQQIARMPSCGGALHTGNLHVYRDFIDVRHVATAFRLLAQTTEARGIVNICTGEATALSELVDILICLSGKKVRTEVRQERLRPGELKAVTGSPSRLVEIGIRLPHTNYSDVVASVWNDAKSRWSGVD